ncbi:MAG: TolB family protein [Bacteroidia bacterium]
MKIRYSIIIFIFFIFSCRKDPPIPTIGNNSECLNLYWTNLSGIINWPGVDTVYNTPRFNPNNSNEIVYVQGITSANKSYLVKRNLGTGQETQIISNIWQMPDWSIKDWIVFNHADNQVWKIKSNGDSLTLITKNMQGGFYAIWSPDGNKIAYNTAGTPPYTLITDAKGNYLDSLPYFLSYLTRWSEDSLNICGLPKGNDFVDVAYQNVFTHQGYQPTNNVLDANASNMIYINAIDWTPDSKSLIWANPHGIYQTNITTKQTIKIKDACNSKYYTSLSISPDGKKIIAQRYDQKLENNYLYIKSGLSLIDIDGKNEAIIK